MKLKNISTLIGLPSAEKKSTAPSWPPMATRQMIRIQLLDQKLTVDIDFLCLVIFTFRTYDINNFDTHNGIDLPRSNCHLKIYLVVHSQLDPDADIFPKADLGTFHYSLDHVMYHVLQMWSPCVTIIGAREWKG